MLFRSGTPSPLYRFGVCLNKMFDSMRAGKPSICALPLKRSYINDYNCGVCVDPGSVENIIQAIQKIKNMDIAEQRAMGKRGKKAVLDYFNYKSLSERFLRVLESVEE